MITPEASDAQEQKRYDRFRDRVMFPIRNVQGETIDLAAACWIVANPNTSTLQKPRLPQGTRTLWAFEGRTGMRQRGYALVVEGYMDVVALAQHGFENAVATLGTACTAEHVQKLFRFTDSVVFSFDGDAAGPRGRPGAGGCPAPRDRTADHPLPLPAHRARPDSYVRDLGAEAFERAVEAALPLSRQLLQVSSEGCDLAGPEGRARMLATARPLWSLLPDDGLLKRQILGELARAAQLPEEELRALWSGQPTRPDGARPPAADSARRPGRAALQRAAAAARRSPLARQGGRPRGALAAAAQRAMGRPEPGRPPPAARPARASRPADRLVGAAFAAPRAQRLGDHRCRLARRRARRHAGPLLRSAAGVVEETQPQADLQAALRLLWLAQVKAETEALLAGGLQGDADRRRYQSCCNEPPSCGPPPPRRRLTAPNRP